MLKIFKIQQGDKGVWILKLIKRSISYNMECYIKAVIN